VNLENSKCNIIFQKSGLFKTFGGHFTKLWDLTWMLTDVWAFVTAFTHFLFRVRRFLWFKFCFIFTHTGSNCIIDNLVQDKHCIRTFFHVCCCNKIIDKKVYFFKNPIEWLNFTLTSFCCISNIYYSLWIHNSWC
jgi:hypothetical protein